MNVNPGPSVGSQARTGEEAGEANNSIIGGDICIDHHDKLPHTRYIRFGERERRRR